MRKSECPACGAESVAEGRVLCKACEWKLVDAIRECAASAGPLESCALHEADRRQHGVTDSIHGRGRGSAPLPVGVAYWEELGRLRRLASASMGAVGLKPTASLGRDIRSLLSRVSVLVTARSEETGDAAEWLAEWVAERRAIARLLDPPEERVCVGRCPSCGGRVWATGGARFGSCALCGRVADAKTCAAERARGLVDSLEYGLPSDIAKRLAWEGIRCPAATIRSWVHRGRIKADAQGMVRLGDVALRLVGVDAPVKNS